MADKFQTHYEINHIHVIKCTEQCWFAQIEEIQTSYNT